MDLNRREILNDERIRLLKEINQLDGDIAFDARKSSAVEELKNQYNTIMEQMDSTPRPTLPFEVWKEIIHYAASSTADKSEWSVNNLLHLTHVSQEWSESILSTPGFWTDITISSHEDDFEAKVALCIHLSRGLPLNIHYRLPLVLGTWDRVREEVSKCNSRIRSIYLSKNKSSSRFVDLSIRSEIAPMLVDLGHLPSLSASNVQAGIATYVQLCPLLSQAKDMISIGGADILGGLLRLESVQHLRRITLNELVNDALPFLQKLRYLEEVTFGFVPLDLVPKIGEFASRITTMDEATTFTSKYLPWRALRIHYDERNLFPLEPLLNTLSVSLVELHLPVHWKALSEFLLVCAQLRNLERLGLALPCPDFWYYQKSFECVETSGIRRLYIDQHAFASERMEYLPDSLRPNTFLFQALTAWAPLVKVLRVATCASAYQGFGYAESLRGLTSLSVSQDSTIKPGTRHLPTLEAITLASDAAALYSIVCPNTLEMTFSSSLSIPGYRIKLNFATENWQNLRALTIEVNTLHTWADLSLPRVERIQVKNNWPYLLQDLTQEPGIFPSLKQIWMKEFPDWNFLFIMLEERNFHPDTSRTISRIEAIRLPLAPTRAILEPLSTRLRGHFSPQSRPSNFELSFDLIAPIYFNSEIPGCSPCHKARVFCDMPVPNPASGYQIDMSSIPPYPASKENFFTSFEMRHNTWNICISSSSRGQISSRCTKYTHKLTEITGYNYSTC